MIKLIYKPWGMVAGVIGGALAGTLFKQVWRLVSGEEESPVATDRSRGWFEVVLAAGLQGLVYGAVKAFVDRGGAAGFEKERAGGPARSPSPPEPARATDAADGSAGTAATSPAEGGLEVSDVLLRLLEQWT